MTTGIHLNGSLAASGRNNGNRVWRRFRRHKLAVVGIVLITVLVMSCAAGPLVLPFDPLHIDIHQRFTPPTLSAHFFGTDQLGRDLLVRVLSAGRISLTIGLAAMVVSTAFGTLVGILAGYYGGWVRMVLMRFVDAMLSFPQIFLLLVLAAFIQPSILTITLLVAATTWMEVARVVEGQIRSLRERDFVHAAETFGASGRYVMFRELLPNAMGPIIVAGTLAIARAILLEAYVSFLGYGVQAPTASWGNMLNDAQQYLGSAPWLAIFPGLAITLAVASFNFVGDGLRDALDARGDLH
ncbi:ABC transporter permease [Mesorhizobium sp. B2-5-13]|uniref:ABC transporter permease n=1 Tax=unclassified Mesorhizobium TaxID=325217 RepID=UPI00112CA46B|nr:MULTISPECIES: ABC transporter permease [unclassified Mesorhizobium]TPJ81939.1 ABC transporter permease [Mesorhizobium sp. B2-5-13]TPK45876.1 ABC transporter permease [Mesorhizobium sp. B2-5-5]